MSKGVYRDPVIAAVIDLLEAEGSPELKGRYYYGDILLAPRGQMPFCSIAIDNQAITSADSGNDVAVIPLVINVVVETTKDVHSWDVMAGTNKLYDLLCGRNADYSLKSTSIAGIIRKHAEVPGGQLFLGIENTPLSADFGIGVDRRGAGIFSIEGTLRVNAALYTPTPH